MAHKTVKSKRQLGQEKKRWGGSPKHRRRDSLPRFIDDVRQLSGLFSDEDRDLLGKIAQPDRELGDWAPRDKMDIKEIISRLSRSFRQLRSVENRHSFLKQAKKVSSVWAVSRNNWIRIVSILGAYFKVLCLFGYIDEDLVESLTRLLSALPANEDGKLLTLHDALTGLPFGISMRPNSDIAQVASRLDGALYGLDDVKRAIRLELVLATHATGPMHPTPLLLVGPPGTGKTAVAEAIASAVGLPFVRVSLAGHCDIVHLKGSAFSWSSSGPGIFVQSLIAAQSQAAVILLDECDKSGGYANSSVTNLLGELLDPDQCYRYQDLFLTGLPIDLSEIIWVLTANDLDKVPDFVQNRCKVISLRNYTAEEKLVIIRDFFPTQIAKHRGFDFSISVDPEVAQRLASKASSLREAKRMLTEMVAGALERKTPGTFTSLIVNTWDDAVVTKEPEAPKMGFDV